MTCRYRPSRTRSKRAWNSPYSSCSRSVATSGGATSVTTVSGRKLTQRHATQFQELLQGLPGVEVSGTGANMHVRIRGTNSLNGDSEPLYVLDGNIVSSGTQGLLALDPQDVARIDVLRDAGATSLYGSRGANGVIVITTKRAR